MDIRQRNRPEKQKSTNSDHKTDDTNEYDEMNDQKNKKNQSNDNSKCTLRCYMKYISLLIVISMLIILVVVPVVFRSSSTIQRGVVFMNFLNFHFLYNISDYKQFNLNCTRAFRINSDPGILLGTWHILPNEAQCSLKSNIDENFNFNDDRLVVLYFHGNSGSRSVKSRVALYKRLSNELKAHVITFDYRGYSDSTNVAPSATGLISDAKHVYRWLLDQGVPPKRVLIWGHSLGTAVTARFLSECPDEINPMAGVLEAPFTTLSDVASGHPFAKIFRLFPHFKYFFLDPLEQNKDTNFNTTFQLATVRRPLLILHAKDDRIIPFEIGKNTYQQAIDQQPNQEIKKRTKFISYPAENGYGHKYISRDPDLIKSVKEFINSLSN